MDPRSRRREGADLRVWLGACLLSLALHGALMAALALWKDPRPPVRRVVPLEAIFLAQLPPGPGGGGGTPAGPPPVRAETPKPPAPVPPVRPKAKPKPRLQAPSPRPVEPPPPALALPRPAPPPASLRQAPAAPAPPARTAPPGGSLAAGSGGGPGGSGGGTGGGQGPGTGTGAGPGSGSGNPLAAYLQEVRRLLERHKDYPLLARQLHLEGVAVVQFTIAEDGCLENAGLKRSSGHELLDRAAQETVRRVGRFPPLPPGLGRERLALAIPISFRLLDR
ncbi:MAG: energy transducer TonB [Syntrophobacterales bacterium]|nr:energy transducer TonB [Syntrophobacterales bacterium]